jgi:uncharacterized phage-associated protein
MRDKPLFDGTIEAWTHGPVIREAYSSFADHGNQPIPFQEVGSESDLSVDERAFVTSIWESYKPYSATELRRMTHTERPWVETRGDLAPDDRSERVIPDELMREFFRNQYDENAIPGLELKSLMAAEADFATGRVIDLNALREAS